MPAFAFILRDDSVGQGVSGDQGVESHEGVLRTGNYWLSAGARWYYTVIYPGNPRCYLRVLCAGSGAPSLQTNRDITNRGHRETQNGVADCRI